jgi:1-acyl-sn-glycerol-3-phosphate acyltransferase
VFSKKIPLLKFFLKKELLWSLPIAGLACKAVGFPFMERHSREDLRKKPELRNADIESAKKACIKFKEHPCTVMNFVEGTRFSSSKKERQDSPYQHLLKPKSGGVAVVLNEMHDSLKGIVNVTIGYSNPEFSFWDFVCGRVNKIVVRYQLLPVTEDLLGDFYKDRNYRSNLQSWLNQLWQEKDQQLDKLQQQHTIS